MKQLHKITSITHVRMIGFVKNQQIMKCVSFGKGVWFPSQLSHVYKTEREGNFQLYILVLRKLIEWYFIFNKFNYSWWLRVHLFDLMTIETMFPYIYENFNKGFFTFQKSENQFSQMALDQVHEQNNPIIKWCGGATELVNKVKESALIRWETRGPEVVWIINEFEELMKLETSEEDDSNLHLHHEDSATYRKKFSSNVKTLCKSLTINPFSQTNLMTISNSHVIPDVAFNALKKMKEVGERQFIDFFNDWLIYQKVSICETIPKNDFCIWYAPEIDTEKPFLPFKFWNNKDEECMWA